MRWVLVNWQRRKGLLIWMLMGAILTVYIGWMLWTAPSGGVTLEFVGMVTHERSTETGALAEFRLKNGTKGEITYYGDNVEEPLCDVCDVPFVAGQKISEGGIASHVPHPAASYYFGPGKPFTVNPGAEVAIYARVLRARGPWQLVMDYYEDSTGWWARFVPHYFHGWLIPQRTLGPAIKLKSEVMDIKVRGLDFGQRYTLMQYRMYTNSPPGGVQSVVLVTNADGRFNLKFITKAEAAAEELGTR